MYRTGDRGLYRADGTIEFLGRQDLQVKVQGYRIELGEIEAALTRHPSVQEAVAAALGGIHEGKRLVAYIVPKAHQELSTGDLHQFLAVHVPKYMIPTQFFLLDALPLSVNGKVDRKALQTRLQMQAMPDGETEQQRQGQAAAMPQETESQSPGVVQVLQISRMC